MLQKGVDVTASDRRGISPLHLAAENGLVAIVRELALFGAEVDCEDLNGQTPLDYAMRKKKNVVIEALRELGATNQSSGD